jgi:hypothetical protein
VIVCYQNPAHLTSLSLMTTARYPANAEPVSRRR